MRSKKSLTTHPKWRLDTMENYSGALFLAEGAYGRVYKVLHTLSNNPFAMKL
jgi:hypothetical protein